MQLNEKSIWNNIQKGDVDAYKSLFEFHYNELYFFARKYLTSKEVAEEIVQDVFITLWENKEDLNITKSVTSYLYTSVKNRSINYIKSKINKIDFVGIQQVANKGHELSADRILELSELDDLIVQAVASLPPRCKEMFHLSRNAEMTYQEIADYLGVSKETVKSQISEALKRIKAFLNTHWEQLPK